ncbi:MAG: NACHT domain-containing protein [Leptolyngbya sp. SIOISBB]|nr:NACHT domain-containing protein [Leptolyngbya sp. SIOISBB]
MEPITSASAIVGLVGAITDQAIRAGGYAHKEIKAAYTGVQAEQKKLAAAQNYIRRYDQRHCQVKVMPGLMKEPLPLEGIYTAVKLLDDQSIRYFVGLDDLEETYRAKGRRSFGRGEGERQDGMAVTNTEQYLMVLGGPGIGKSTFLRKIGLEALKSKSDNTKQIHRSCIPVLIELKELRGETVDLKQKIADEFATCGFPEAAAFTEASLAQGKLLVLLDGLDEVPTRNLNTVIKHIEDFVDAHDQNAFVASCRIAAYRSSQGAFFNRFTDVTLAEFDDEQIEQFIHRWFRSQLDMEAGTANRYWELLQKDEHKATKELAQTPLLLTFLCLVYDREQTLPAQRSTLYGKALNILLSEWAAQKRLEQDPIYEGFHPDLGKVLLAEIAYDSFKNDQLFFSKNDLTRRISTFLADTLDAPKHLDGAKVLQAIEKQQGILVERATDIYSFSHLTLQEYLTAFHIVEARLEDELIAQHLTDERWREVFLLTSGLSGNRAINLLHRLHNQSQTYLVNTPKLRDLIAWATTSTEGTPGNDKPVAKRASAINSIIDRAFTFTINSAIDSAIDSARAIARASDSARAIDSTIDSDSDSDSVIGSDSDSDSVIGSARAITSAIGIASARASAFTLDSDIDIDIESARAFGRIFASPKFADLPSQLECMLATIPKVEDPSVAWRIWADELEALWLDALGLDQAALTFTKAEAEALRDYLYVTELLIRCKDAAVRIPKQAWADLEARLLKVPPESES